MGERLFGVETEYAIVPGVGEGTGGAASIQMVLPALMNAVALHEPCVSDGSLGVFLATGSRLYVDCGSHAEWAICEVSNPWDVVRYTLAGDRVLLAAADRLATTTTLARPAIFRNNVHYGSGTTWGMHESVSHQATSLVLQRELLPFLVTRTVFAGAGGFDVMSQGIVFVLSPRARFLTEETSISSTGSRGLFHLKDEPLCAPPHGRLHLLCGESLHSELAAWVRAASLAIVVSMAEAGVEVGARLALADSIRSLDRIIQDPACTVPLLLADGTSRTAIEIQRAYLEEAERHVGSSFMPAWADVACRQWRGILDRLGASDPGLSASIDWRIKHELFGRRIERAGFTWASIAAWTGTLDDAWLTLSEQSDECGDELIRLFEGGVGSPEFIDEAGDIVAAEGLAREEMDAFLELRRELFELDFRFGQLGDGVFASLDRSGVLNHHLDGVDNIEHAMSHPPAVGRARLRGQVIRRVQGNREAFAAGWDFVRDESTGAVLDLSNPWETEERWRMDVSGRRRPDHQSAPGPLHRRDEALGCFLTGDLARAEMLLIGLLVEGFQPASTLTHLARVTFLAGRVDEARRFADEAWARRHDAPTYVTGRALWFQAVFALLDGRDERVWMGRLKVLLRGIDCQLDWAMAPVIAHLRTMLPGVTCDLLATLVDALSGRTDGPLLDQVPGWSLIEEVLSD